MRKLNLPCPKPHDGPMLSRGALHELEKLVISLQARTLPKPTLDQIDSRKEPHASTWTHIR